jgi:hypothetical protein
VGRDVPENDSRYMLRANVRVYLTPLLEEVSITLAVCNRFGDVSGDILTEIMEDDELLKTIHFEVKIC